jgi:RNA polymerase sigma-70 factor (ECF subfamily)
MAEYANPGPTGAGEDELSLIERVLAGDSRAFEPLVRRHERRVFRVALAVLGNIQDAEEAMQDTFVKVFRHLGQFRRESRFSTWLTRIAINEALQKRQRRKDFAPLDESHEKCASFVPQRYEAWRSDPESIYGKRQIRRLIEAAIESLPQIYREAFVLRDVEGMGAEEAAEAIGISVPALKSRLLRARLMMRESLAASFEEPRTLKRKIVNTAVEIRDAVALRVMRAAGR